MNHIFFNTAIIIRVIIFKVVVWGHSLGSAICSHMVAEFDMETGGSSTVTGVVLEAPFNNMHDELLTFRSESFFLSWFFILQPCYEGDGVEGANE